MTRLTGLISASTTLTGTGQCAESDHTSRNAIGNMMARVTSGVTATYAYTECCTSTRRTAAGGNRYAYDKNGNPSALPLVAGQAC
jgi:hypothetical protein